MIMTGGSVSVFRNVPEFKGSCCEKRSPFRVAPRALAKTHSSAAREKAKTPPDDADGVFFR